MRGKEKIIRSDLNKLCFIVLSVTILALFSFTLVAGAEEPDYEVEIIETDSPVIEGEELDVTAQFKNNTEGNVYVDIELLKNGEVLDSEENLGIFEDDYRNEILTWDTEIEDAGEHTLEVKGDFDGTEKSDQEEVTVEDSDFINIVNIDLPDRVYTEDNLNEDITVEVENTKDVSVDDVDITVKMTNNDDFDESETKTRSLSPGTSSYLFPYDETWEIIEKRDYTVNVDVDHDDTSDEEQKTLTVYQDISIESVDDMEFGTVFQGEKEKAESTLEVDYDEELKYSVEFPEADDDGEVAIGHEAESTYIGVTLDILGDNDGTHTIEGTVNVPEGQTPGTYSDDVTVEVTYDD